MLLFIRNFLALIIGVIVGMMVNGGIISLNHLIPLPEGADVSTMEALAESIHLFEPKHFIIPFLAHALGTLTGAFVAVIIGGSKHMTLGMIIGSLSFLGGVAAVYMIPAPLWFEVADLVLAYFPMAWLGVLISGKTRKEKFSFRFR